MPRLARLDASGVLHHIIIRGIERRKIFRDDQDKNNLIDRLSILLPETKTSCYAWALMSNHAHFLIRSGKAGISTLMRRLLTGYAIYFNRKYRRHGQLFQNRYKSIICQEDIYFKEQLDRRYELKALGYDLEKIAHRVSELYGIDEKLTYSKGRRKLQIQARDLMCYWAVEELGLSRTDVAKRLRINQPAVGYAVNRGEKIAKKHNYRLAD